MKNYLEIKNDVYFICQRLRDIDDSYFLLYNLDRQAYEVHSSAQGRDSFCFTVPYEQLDARTIEFALKTSAHRRDELIKEIEKNNQLVYERELKRQVNLLKEAL